MRSDTSWKMKRKLINSNDIPTKLFYLLDDPCSIVVLIVVFIVLFLWLVRGVAFCLLFALRTGPCCRSFRSSLFLLCVSLFFLRLVLE